MVKFVSLKKHFLLLIFTDAGSFLIQPCTGVYNVEMIFPDGKSNRRNQVLVKVVGSVPPMFKFVKRQVLHCM